MHTDVRPRCARIRGTLATVLLAALVVTAGCSLRPDSEPIRASASVASVPNATLDATGYERVRAESRWLNVTLTESIQGDVELSSTREIRAKTSLRTYERSTDAGRAAVSILAVPGVRLFENRNLTTNPARDLSTAELVNRTLPTGGGVSDLRPTGTRTVTLLGTETAQTAFRATATRGGGPTRIRVLVATVERGGDFVTAVAVVPADADERRRIRTLLDAVER
jgi:hypothetical protein